VSKLPIYQFKDIAINCTEKVKAEDIDISTYIGLEHLDSGSLSVSRWGSDVPIKGEKLVMHKGDVLFGKRNTYLRRAAIAPHDGAFSAHGMVLRPKESVVNKEFFPLFIASDYFFDAAIRISVGSLSPTVNWKDLKDLEFNIPTISEQQELSKILWAINNTKEAYKKLLQETDELVKSQFIEMITEHSNGFKAIGDLVETKIEKVKDLPESIHSIKYIDISSLDNERKCVTGYTEYELSKAPSRAQQVIEKGDILLSTVRPNLEGRAVNQYEGDNIVASTGFCILRAKKCEPAYIWGIISSRQFVTDICEIAHGISYPAVNDKDILGYMAPDLDDQYQKQYADILEQSDKSKFELSEAIKELDAMYRRILKDNLG
jgi:type I restriction enzyme S subunit